MPRSGSIFQSFGTLDKWEFGPQPLQKSIDQSFCELDQT